PEPEAEPDNCAITSRFNIFKDRYQTAIRVDRAADEHGRHAMNRVGELAAWWPALTGYGRRGGIRPWIRSTKPNTSLTLHVTAELIRKRGASLVPAPPWLAGAAPGLVVASLSPWQRGFSIPESRPRQSRNLFGEHAGLFIGEKLIVGRLTAPH